MSMKFLFKFGAKVLLSAAVLYLLNMYLPGFIVRGDYVAFLTVGAALAFISTVIRPIVRLITAPIVWLTLGLFNLVINVGLLFLADWILPQVQINGFSTLFIASIVIALVNSFA